jgi:hypothetical protein
MGEAGSDSEDCACKALDVDEIPKLDKWKIFG